MNTRISPFPVDEPPVREVSIDVLRYLMLYCVVAIHVTAEMPRHDHGVWTPLLLDLCGIAVPSFFVMSGYFLKWDEKNYLRCLGDPIVRLVPLYVFWLAIYAFVSANVTGSVPFASLRDLASGGVAYHLWFLPALAFALIVVAMAAKAGGRWLALAICALLAATGFLRGAYHDLLHIPGGVQRGGVFMAPLFVWLGAEMRRRDWGRMRLGSIVALTAIVMVLTIAENAFISSRTGQPLLMARAYTLMTIPLGCAGLALARSIPSHIWPGWMIRQSRLTFGVYAIHLLLIYELMAVFRPGGLLACLTMALVVFVLVSLLTRAIAVVPQMRRFVA